MAIMAILDRLSAEDRAAVEARCSFQRYAAGETVISHLDATRDVFIVLEGRLRVTLYSCAGREVDYRDVGPGDLVGELAAIDGAPRSATVAALEPARLAHLPATAFRELVETRPGFTMVLLQHLSAQIRRLTERVFELSTLAVRQRLRHELLRLAEEAGVRENRAEIRPAPTHFKLAARIGAYREAVSREMSVLQKAGLVEKRRGALIVHDRDKLERFVAGTG